MRILITGGAGFIGSHLCDALLLKGNQVSILDNLSTGSMKNLSHLNSRIKVFSGDIRDRKLVESLVRDHDFIFHLAASVGVKNILENPVNAILTNFLGSEIVLSAAEKFEKKILIASTSEIYGKNVSQPLSESDDRVIGTPQKLRWSYSDSKALEEALAHSLHIKNGLQVITVRFFNIVGPRQLGNYGMVIPRFIDAALSNRPLVVFGNGHQSRTFCHVRDAVDGLVSLMSEEKCFGHVFNIGHTSEISILELARYVVDFLDSDSNIILHEYSEYYPIGFEDVERRVPNIDKIKKFVNWSPKLDIESVIRDMVVILT
jgi:UDP-glucose 4-epimerase